MSIHRRTTKKGDVRYDVRLRKPDGTPYSTTFRTKREAERFQANETATRQQGTWIDPKAGKITFRDWADEWHATMMLTWRRSTAQRHRVALDRYWIPALGASQMASIGPRNVQRVINEMASACQPSTVRSYYGTVRSLFGDAVDTDIIARSPCRGIKLPSPSDGAKIIIGPDDLHRLAEAVGPEWRLLIYLGGVMGLRFGEAIAVTAGDVDHTTGVLAITKAVSEVDGRTRIASPKTATSIRTLVMPKGLIAEAAGHIEDHALGPDDLLFSDSLGGPVRRANFRARIWLPAIESTGLHGLTFHGLRHSAATHWISEGIDARTVQHLLGHADPRLVLKLYAHATDQALAKAADSIAGSYWPDGSTA